MKKPIFLVLILVGLLYPQTDSLAFKYYPLQIGNEWQYEVITDTLFNPETTYSHQKILADSILDNGLKYFIRQILPDSILRFERIDSSQQKVYAYKSSAEGREYCVYDFGQADTLEPSKVGNLSIVAKQLLIYFNDKDFFRYHRTFSESFGLSSFLYQGLAGYFEKHDLVWAKIKSEEYGKYVTSFEDDSRILPTNLWLSQNYPNPFNSSTIIGFSIPERSFIKINIYDNLGGHVASLVNKKLLPGKHSVSFYSGFLSSGVYYYQLQAGAYTLTKRMILLK